MTQYRADGKAAKPKEEKRGSELDLSIGQVLAATGATTVGAILVKLLDIWGTILGTAILSVCTSIGAVLILHTMRRTGDRIKSQIAALSPAARADQARTVELGDNPTRATATAPIPEVHGTQGAAATEVRDAAEPVGDGEYVAKSTSRKRTLIAILLSSVLVFGLTMGVLFLLGGVTGDPGRFIQLPAPETTTIFQTTETDGESDPGGDGTEPAPSESAGSESPTEDVSETPTETPSETAPTDEATSDAPTEPTPTETDESQGGTDESPVPEDEAPTESPTAG